MSSKKVLALLRIESPDEPERVVPVTKSPFSIGRSVSNDLRLSEELVSRHHARMLCEEGRIFLLDLNSSNGTWVGEMRLVPNKPYRLMEGARFRINAYTLQLQAAPIPSTGEKPKPAHDARPGAVDVPIPPAEPETTPRVALGVVKMPPPPPKLPPPSKDGQPAYDKAFGLPQDGSRYLKYLPPIYRENEFLGRFLLAFEGILTPIEQTVDNFDLYLAPLATPPFFLDQLAGWLDLTLDEKWPPEKRRAVVVEASDLYRRRGTRWSLGRLLEIYTEVTPQIVEPEDKPHHFEVRLRIPRGHKVNRATVKRIIEANKPAHTTYSLEIESGGQ